MLTTLKTVATSCYSALFLTLLVVLPACAPNGPKTLMEGERLLQAGQAAEALPKLQKATELLPQNAQAWNHLGLAYHQTGKLESAAAAYNQALKLDRNLVAVRYNLGTLWLDNNDPARALSELKTFTLLQPDSIDGHVQRGNAHVRLKQWSEAETEFATVLRLSKNTNAEGFNGMGMVLLQRQRARDAVTYFNAALQQNSNFAPARLNLAVVYHQNLTNYPLALNQYRAYLAIKPRPADADAVAAVVKQLEALLPSSPASAIPNAPMSIAAAAAAARTNPATATVKPPVAEPLTGAKSTNHPTEIASSKTTKPAESPAAIPTPPVAPKPEAPKTMAKAEPIRVTPEPVKVVPPPVVAPPPAPKPEIPVVATAKPVETVSTPIPVTPVEKAPKVAVTAPEPEAAEKPGFFQRINPINLFRSKPKATTPLPSNPTGDGIKVATVNKPVKKSVEPAAAPIAPIPVTNPPPVIAPPVVVKAPVIPRYPYLRPGPFSAGDRKMAQTAFDEALAAQKSGNWPTAIAAYRKAAIADPTFYEAYYNLGWTAYEAKDVRQALVAYEHALAVQSDSFDARYNFALALQQTGFYLDAAEELRTLTKNNPDRAQAHLMLAGLLSSRLTETEEARQHYLKVLALEPNHPKAVEIRYWLRANQ